MDTISVIVPCLDEQLCLELFYSRILSVLEQMKSEERLNYEIIFVDDGSHDQSLNLIKKFAHENPSIAYLSFSRNFGKEAAIIAGLEHCSGDYVAIIDADLQDPPELLRDMFKELQNEQYDCIAARRVNRNGEPVIRSCFARLFYKLIRKVSGLEIADGARDFRLMTKQMANAIVAIKERNRFSKGLFSWIGFETKWIEVENCHRCNGESKWSFFKLVIYSFDGIVAFSNVPLAITSIFGLIFFFLSIFIIIIVILRTLIFGDPVAGWASTACIIFFTAGIQCLCMGILGLYISKSYIEVKQRPCYIIKQIHNINKKEIKE